MDVMKIAYHFNPETLLFSDTSNVYLVHGYQEHIKPQCSTWEPLPKYNKIVEQCRYVTDEGTWRVEPKLVAIGAYHTLTQEEKTFDDITLVTDDYTIKKPTTKFDEWIDGSWITNLSNKYIAEYDKVDSKRRALYSHITDPLYIESMRAKEAGDIAKYEDFKEQADALADKIKVENPWPINPEA
jgi:hypothetical protein